MKRSHHTTGIGTRIRNVGRLAQIANVFARHGLYFIFQSSGLASWLTPEQAKQAEGLYRELHPDAADDEEREKSSHDDGADSSAEAAVGEADAMRGAKPKVVPLPARLRSALEELGPAFVKLGQVLATRQDLVPADYIEELRKLHQDVRGISYTAIHEVLIKELGAEKLATLETIDETPLAAGSIAQVHRATLKSGEQIVLKVQRPNIDRQINQDLALMETAAHLLEKYFEESRSIRPSVIMSEFRRTMIAELDFIREAGSTTKIGRSFADTDYVEIPRVHWEYTSKRVLALSYVEGFSIYDQEKLREHNIDSIQLVERALTCFMQMVFVDGFYHGDLHPGNLLVLPGSRVGIIDFGVAIKISRSFRERIAGLMMAIVDEDYDLIAHYFLELTNPDIDFDLEAFTYEVSNAMAPFIGLDLGEMNTGTLLWDLARISASHGAPLPREMILFLRTFVSFEGAGRDLNPDFDVMDCCSRFSAKIVEQMYSPETLKREGLRVARDLSNLATFAPRQIRNLLRAATEGNLSLQVHSQEVESLAQSVDRASARVSVALTVGSLLIASAIMVFARVGQEFYDLSLFGVIGFSLAGLLSLYVIYSILRGGGDKL